jgi:PilZ domain
MGRRREPRANLVLPIRVLGVSADNRPFNESVETLNISRRGVVLTGVQCQLKVGEVVGLRYGEKKARYRVVWVRRPDPSQSAQVALEAVEEGKSLWDFELPCPAADQYLLPRSPRKYPRYQLDVPVELFLEGSPRPILARTSDIGLGGCYVPLLTPPRVGIGLRIVLWLGQGRPTVQGRVVFSNRGVGMGIEFGKMSKESRELLRAFLESPVAVVK